MPRRRRSRQKNRCLYLRRAWQIAGLVIVLSLLGWLWAHQERRESPMPAPSELGE